jgi:MFS family permease
MIRIDSEMLPRLGRLPFALAACFALAAMMLTTFPIVSPDVVSELGLSYVQTGAIGATYMLGYGLFQLPVSVLGVRLGSGRVLFGATVLMSAAALLPCLVASFFGWLTSRFLMGIAGAAVLPLGIHLLTQAMSGPRLVMGLGVFLPGWGIGMTLAMLGAAPLLHAFGWRAVLIMSTALGVIVIASLQWALPAALRGKDAAATNRPNLGELVRRLGGNQALNMMGVVNAAGTTVLICVPTWLPLYLTSTFGVSAAETSASLSPIGIGVAVGAWAGGALTIPLGWRRVVVASLIASSLLVALIPLQSSALLIVVTAILLGCVGMLFPVPIQSLFPFVMPQEWAALATGYYNTIGFIGAFSASLVFGYLVDCFSSFTVGWFLLASVPVVGVVAALLIRIPARVHSTPSLK